ncbi:Rac GTPase-activating protein 1 [Strongyloides ratti]|uniref:Rac GTPase-activating protein 1 n=1 Tax=Strongyloides ratti TaxID=34506 RepID=A0A090LBL7_STRRB|nr:Rac GTPase-activating protein 1 [Strongyloides ratti]CEF64925.1 Rac GTPase-activating protein 1 [Strongyloides ratti]
MSRKSRSIDSVSLLQDHVQLVSAYESLFASSSQDVIDAYEFTLSECEETSSFKKELNEIVSYCDSVVEKNKYLEGKIKKYKEEIASLKEHLSVYEKENKHLRNCVENLKNTFAVKIEKVKTKMKDSNITSTDSEDDIDFDMTGESGKSEEGKIALKQKIIDEEENFANRESLTSDTVAESLKRSASDVPKRSNKIDRREFNLTVAVENPLVIEPIKEYIESTSNLSWTNGSYISEKNHRFFTKGFHIGMCNICDSILFKSKNVLSCSDCHLLGHISCLSNTTIPCVPRHSFPKIVNRIRLSLAECCPGSNPMIPYIIIRCVIAIEQFYISHEGIYRVPGNPENIQRLFASLKNPKTSVDLSKEFPETIVGCIKRFLRELREPLIPSSSWDEFTSAAEMKNIDGINLAFCDLPRPNADTLAFICAHLQKVIKNCEVNKMQIENISQVMGPIIVGFPKRSRRSDSMTLETKEHNMAKQITTMKTLLSLPQTYWDPFLKPISTRSRRSSLSRPILNKYINTDFFMNS